MHRRKFLVGMGSLAAGTAVTVGTGAFTSVSADRTVTVSVEEDSKALLQMVQEGASNNEYASTSSGQITIDLDNSDDGGGDDLNRNAETDIFSIFTIRNQGTQPVFVYVDPSSVTPQEVKPDGDDDGNKEYGEGGGSKIYLDPQASNRPNEGPNFPGQAVSMTGIYGVHDPTAGFDASGPSSSTDLKPEDLTLGVGESFDFGLFVRTADDPPQSLDVSMNIVADAELAADI